MEISSSKKIALVHDWYSSKFSGGAESTVKIMNEVQAKCFIEALIFSAEEPLDIKSIEEKLKTRADIKKILSIHILLNTKNKI